MNMNMMVVIQGSSKVVPIIVEPTVRVGIGATVSLSTGATLERLVAIIVTKRLVQGLGIAASWRLKQRQELNDVAAVFKWTRR